MVYLRSDWWLSWSTHMTAMDASPYGLGVCTAERPRTAVQEAGRISERSRFRLTDQGMCRGARESYFIANADHMEFFDISDPSKIPEPTQRWSVDPRVSGVGWALAVEGAFHPSRIGALHAR